MALTKETITGSDWTAITTAGQSGVCMVYATDAYKGKNRLFLTHTDGTPDGTTPSVPLLSVRRSDEATIITADSASDVFYVKCAESDGSTSLWVDVN